MQNPCQMSAREIKHPAPRNRLFLLPPAWLSCQFGRLSDGKDRPIQPRKLDTFVTWKLESTAYRRNHPIEQNASRRGGPSLACTHFGHVSQQLKDRVHSRHRQTQFDRYVDRIKARAKQIEYPARHVYDPCLLIKPTLQTMRYDMAADVNFLRLAAHLALTGCIRSASVKLPHSSMRQCKAVSLHRNSDLLSLDPTLETQGTSAPEPPDTS